MPFPGQSWPLNLKVVACIFHVLALASGIFRSTYRWHISRFGRDDAWALLALLTDVGCLLCAGLQRSVPLQPSNTDTILNWVAEITLTSVPWASRLSMIVAIIRITNPRPSIRHTSYAIAITFALMWFAMLVQKSYDCATRLCVLAHNVAISQLITDAVSDACLVLMPILFLRGVKIYRSQRVLLISSFASAVCITIVSIAQSVSLLLLPMHAANLLFTHIKAALSLIICNLLVIVTFAYQFYRKTDIDSINGESTVQLTTVVVPGSSCSTILPGSNPSSRMETNDVSPTPAQQTYTTC